MYVCELAVRGAEDDEVDARLVGQIARLRHGHVRRCALQLLDGSRAEERAIERADGVAADDDRCARRLDDGVSRPESGRTRGVECRLGGLESVATDVKSAFGVGNAG